VGKGGSEWCKGAPDTPSCACGALQLKHEALMPAAVPRGQVAPSELMSLGARDRAQQLHESMSICMCDVARGSVGAS
jgi:hypothetical protein